MRKMFQSAVIKLTAWYVGALLLVCILFSLPLYNVAANRLKSGAQRQTEVVQRLPNPFVPERVVSQLERLREQQLKEDRQQLISAFILINLIVIGLGAVASYLFARRTLRPIEEAHAAQANFTAHASHELRTPLAVMQTEIDVALRKKQLTSSEAKEILTSNLEEVARLRQLSDQLLGLTRAGAESLQLQNVDLAKLVKEHMQLLGKRHGLSITVEAPKKVIVSADKLLLAQVLDILVDNAVTYSGLPDPQIRVVVAKDKNRAVIRVTNKGKVIPSRDIQRIFERFYRGQDAAAQNSKGHGLGLVLATDIVERHEGELRAKSSKATGTEFSISLPL